MARITISGARELRIVAARDRLDGEAWREVRMNEARARGALSRLVGDAAAMASVRALLSEVSPGAGLHGLGDHDVIADLAWYVARRECRAFERVNVVAPGPAPARAAKAPAAAAPAAPPPEKAKDPKVLTVRWGLAEGWCSEPVDVSGTTQDHADGAALLVEAQDRASRKTVASVQAKVSGNAFSKSWPLKDVLPEKAGGKFVKKMELDATAGGVKAPAPLAVRFVPEAPRTRCTTPYGRFDMTVEEYVAKIEADLRYVPGWAAEVVLLGAAVPAGTGGVIAGFTWPGYRWMRATGRGKEYWNGAAWVGLPATFRLNDANNFCVGFYKTGASYTCQYGGSWPGEFAAWDVEAPAHQAKLRAWGSRIETTWGGKLDLKRDGCESAAPACCRYGVKVAARFERQAAFAQGLLIVAAGDIRSNSALWFLGDADLAMAAHEFGHHLGNGDEYEGATSVDPALNGDGAVNGIDDDSIMGAGLSGVKKRHLRTVCAHLASMVRSASGKSYTYQAVSP